MTVVTLSADAMVDDSLDFAAPPAAKSGARRNLLVAPPSIAAHEERLRALYATFPRADTDLQMLDRLSAGLVALPAETYDLVMVLMDAGGAPRADISRDLYALLVPALKAGGQLRFEDAVRAAEQREAILAGLVAKDGGFEKIEEEEVVIPLRFGAKKKNGVPPVAVVQKAVVLNLDDDDDDLIDENELLSAEDLKRPIQIRTYSVFRSPAIKS